MGHTKSSDDLIRFLQEKNLGIPEGVAIMMVTMSRLLAAEEESKAKSLYKAMVKGLWEASLEIRNSLRCPDCVMDEFVRASATRKTQ